MRKITSIVWISFALIWGGCEGFLDAKPEKSLVIPDSLDDFQALLDAEPRSMNSMTKMGFLSSDELVLANPLVNLLTLEERASYLWEGDYYTPDDPGVDWAFTYRKVFYANLVIEGVRDYKPINETERERARQLDAAARFYRAFAHFSLATQFMGPYDPSNPDMPGIPVRKAADLNATSPRLSAKEVFDFIREDLEVARTILSPKPDIPTRASAWAAEALLSRVCLYMQDYESAFIHAGNALEIANELLDYNTLNKSLRNIFPRFNQEVIHYAHMFSGRFTSNNQMYVNPDLYAMYDANDLRKSLLFSPSPVAGRMNCFGRYTGEFLLYGGLATDEVVLDRAEAAARIGNDAQGLADLNYLLENRYRIGDFVPFTDLTGKNLIKKIAEERRKELVFRGVRWLDLRRYNQDPEMAVTLDRKYNGLENKLEPGSARYTFPIPPRELRLNELL